MCECHNMGVLFIYSVNCGKEARQGGTAVSTMIKVTAFGELTFWHFSWDNKHMSKYEIQFQVEVIEVVG